MPTPALVIARLEEECNEPNFKFKTRGEQVVYIIKYRGNDILLSDFIESCVYFEVLNMRDLLCVGEFIRDPQLFDSLHKAVTLVYSDPDARRDLDENVFPIHARNDLGRKFDQMFGFDLISHVSLNLTVYSRPMCYIFKRINEDEEDDTSMSSTNSDEKRCISKKLKSCTLI